MSSPHAPRVPARSRTRELQLLLPITFAIACGGSDSQGPATPPPPTVNAPVIATQPQDATVDVGTSASFTVGALGTAPLTYQWKRAGVNIAGATTQSYSFTASAADNNTTYSVAVSNQAGTIESQNARLTVRTAPAITTQPAARTTTSGTSASFSVEATGSALTYQWRRNGTNVPGATAQSYSVGVPLAGDDGAVYSVVVTNNLGTATSTNAVLTVNSSNVLRATSYANAKALNVPPAVVTAQPYEPARVFGDFFGNGNRDFFVANQVYDWKAPMAEATAGEFQFWRWTGSTYVREAGKVTGSAGCIHARKAAVADFNRDQRPDIFVACHGYDGPPFPGEPNYVLLSQPNGGYIAKAVGNAGFYHNVTALDVNNDGHIDVVVTDNFASKAVFAFVNDGSGNFTQRTDLLPIGPGPFFTVEAADVDNDGRTDLLVGGHDWEGGPTLVLLNNGSGSFANSVIRSLPPVANEGVVLDFVVFDADRDGANEIYVLRTSGGDGTFYESRTVQKVLWPSLTSTVLVTERGQPWVPYIVPFFSGGRYTLTTDVTLIPFTLDL